MSVTLSVQDLEIIAGGRTLVRGWSLALEPGEVQGLVGRSGSGKTTLLRVLAGLADPAAGTLRLQGRTPEQWGWPEWRRRVVYVAQRSVMLPGSVGDNLSRALSYRSVRAARGSAAFPHQQVSQWLQALGLSPELLAQRASDVSEGQGQRVALVRALLIQPQVLLLDEPTSALDVDAAHGVNRLIEQMAASQQMAALVVTHDRGQAERWCTKVAGLGDFAGDDDSNRVEARTP